MQEIFFCRVLDIRVILIVKFVYFWVFAFPRTRGGDPREYDDEEKYKGFSPHTRG